MKSVEKVEQENMKSVENPDQEDGEIGSEERSSHETLGVDDVQPNEEEGDKDEKSSSQTLSDCGDTREFNPTHNSSEISLAEFEELDDVIGDWTKQMDALDRRFAALEEKDVYKMGALNWLSRKVAALEEDVNYVEGFDRRVDALEAYVEKVGEDSPEDVKKRQESGKGVKRTVQTLDENLSRTRSAFKKQK